MGLWKNEKNKERMREGQEEGEERKGRMLRRGPLRRWLSRVRKSTAENTFAGTWGDPVASYKFTTPDLSLAG